ncbi:MAG: DNA polymerase IV [Propionibacteriaceae bacterium]|jgi:DNA polymerase-4|nr:DNA polymerase IV [Propionibacteriaceae bacterium]
MRSQTSILHLDLDAFFASVEQRDKPSLRGKPVVVGGLGGRGVVSTASYEARLFGVHSAMPMHEARRLCPAAAFLSGRFGAYRQASQIVMALLRQTSPLIEPLSLDEAYVDLTAGPMTDFSPPRLHRLGQQVRAEVTRRTGGLTASVGFGSSKFMAKLASEQAKPDGLVVIEPGREVDTIADLPVRAIPGVGPMTAERLQRLGVKTVRDLRQARASELRRELGQAVTSMLTALAWAEDDRPVSVDREVKSISVEDTFAVDIADLARLAPLVTRDAAQVGGRLRRSGHFARTVTLKLKLADFSSHTRSRTLLGAIDSDQTIAQVALDLLGAQGHLVAQGVRLLGVGVSGFTQAAQEALFEVTAAGSDDESRIEADPVAGRLEQLAYSPGQDVWHDDFGPGWVWGSGLGLVTVRFETAQTGPGPIRTLALDDPALRPAPPPLDPAESPDQLDPTPRPVEPIPSGPGWASDPAV